jgi:hypothetical protein
VESTRTELPEHFLDVDDSTSGNVSIGLPERFMQRRPILLIEPIPGVQREKFDFGPFGQIGGFVDD